MPTYDYVCGSCGHEYEMFQSITANPQKKCPSCSRRTAKRLIGAGAGIIFKGAGYYETDYRSEGYKKSAKADKEAASGKKDGKTDGKTDGKKSDTKTKSSESSAKKETPKAGKDS